MTRFQWEGSPGGLDLMQVGTLKVGLTRWNNLAGGERMPRVKRAFRTSVWWHLNGPGERRRRGQIIVPLRRFKSGRRSLYLRVSWGYTR